ncbi:MAG TPA: hypothetical protein VK961_20545 [Chthoniobacter sp.]|nr:hypothetical protein [Chthoniobacter sp.]
MKTNTLTLASLAILSLSAFAGQPVVESKTVTPPEPEVFYRANEFSVGLSALLGVRAESSSRGHRTWDNSTRWGADLEGKYFFTRNFGLGLEQEYLDINRPLWGTALNLYARFPLGVSSRWAPYLFGGAGALYGYDSGRFEGHAGAGLEFRCSKQIGIFTDGRYTWVDGNRDRVPQFGLFRLGLNFVF